MRFLHTISAARTLTLRRLLPLLCAVLLASAAFGSPKNIILMIGDGMSPDTVTAAGAYAHGAAYHRFGGTQRLTMETLAHHLYCTTYSVGKGYDFTWNGGTRAYVQRGATDSAAAGTALATGIKTYDAAIGVNPDKAPVPNIVEFARQHGMRTGVISSVPFSHATPAAFAAHIPHRNHYPAIAHDMLFTVRPDVIMGAGHPEMAAKSESTYQYISREDWDALRGGHTSYRLVESREDFQRLITHPGQGRVFGIFRNHSCLPYRKADRSGENPTVPTLAEMTQASLSVLDNPGGFFLMVEGGAIDWCNHANDLTGSIGETLAFDEAIAAVMAWIERNGGWERNLLIITADHDTGYLNSVKPVAPGTLPVVTWGIDEKRWGGHTNRLVDVYFQGAGSTTLLARTQEAQDFERGAIRYVDNTDIFHAMRASLTLRTAKYSRGDGLRQALELLGVR